MAVALPLLFGSAAAGGAAATAGLIGSAGAFSALTTLGTLATAGSLLSTVQAGKTQAAEYKTQARAEEFNARNREIDRKRNLIQALASQNVRAGASGISGGTGSSAQAIQMADISSAGLDRTIDAGVTSQRVNQLKANAKTAATFSLLSAGSEAINYGTRIKKRGAI